MAKKEQLKAEEPEKTVKLLGFTKKEGWFVFEEYEVPVSSLEGKKTFSSEPDIFPIFKDQVINKIRDFYGL